LNVSGSVFTGVQEINPKGGKESRMNIAAAEWQAHDWYIDRKAGWAESFIEQITTFPSGRYDDMVDAMSQAACWLASFTPTTVVSYEAFTGRVLWRL
jgi:predicted phage terminase large subunit-like protein